MLIVAPDKIVRRMIERKYSCRTLARITGVSARTISRLTRETCRVRIDTLSRLAHALGVDFTDICAPSFSCRTEEHHD